MEGSKLEVVRLADCELCGGLEAPGEKASLLGMRHEVRAAAAVAALTLAISESGGALRQLALGGNRFREAEMGSLHAAAREQSADREMPAALVLDFEQQRERGDGADSPVIK